MKLLLDTHSLIWIAADDGQLSPRAAELFLDPDNEIHLSVASLWEMSIKASLGKLQLQRPLAEIVDEQLSRNAIRLLPIEPAHAYRVATLPWLHRDPIDRLLVAQCLCERIGLLGCDAAMDGYGIARYW